MKNSRPSAHAKRADKAGSQNSLRVLLHCGKLHARRVLVVVYAQFGIDRGLLFQVCIGELVRAFHRGVEVLPDLHPRASRGGGKSAFREHRHSPDERSRRRSLHEETPPRAVEYAALPLFGENLRIQRPLTSGSNAILHEASRPMEGARYSTSEGGNWLAIRVRPGVLDSACGLGEHTQARCYRRLPNVERRCSSLVLGLGRRV